MELKIRVSNSGGGFGGLMGSGTTIDTRISAGHLGPDEVQDATSAALRVLSALGVADASDQRTEPLTAQSEESVPPEAFGETGETAYPEPATLHPFDEAAVRPSAAGDVVSVTFTDHSQRLYFDTGAGYYAPEIPERVMGEHSVPYSHGDIAHVRVVAELGETQGVTFKDGQE